MRVRILSFPVSAKCDGDEWYEILIQWIILHWQLVTQYKVNCKWYFQGHEFNLKAESNDFANLVKYLSLYVNYWEQNWRSWHEDDLYRWWRARTVLITKAICPGIPRMAAGAVWRGPAPALLPATIDIPWPPQWQWNAITTSPLPSWSHGLMESWSHTCCLPPVKRSSDLHACMMSIWVQCLVTFVMSV